MTYIYHAQRTHKKTYIHILTYTYTHKQSDTVGLSPLAGNWKAQTFDTLRGFSPLKERPEKETSTTSKFFPFSFGKKKTGSGNKSTFGRVSSTD